MYFLFFPHISSQSSSSSSSSTASFIINFSFIISNMLLSSLLLLSICRTQITSVSGEETPLFTAQRCNYTLYPKTGCEDEIGAECDERHDFRCRCKPNRPILHDGRFCFIRQCSAGYYFDEYQNVCVAQRRASPSVAESHCRYDFHCYGPNVHCKLYGWNRNCVCDSGFAYGYNGTCIPMHGIGGHCMHDMDCDTSGSRNMYCDKTRNSGLSPISTSATASASGGGQCSCAPEHSYNYLVDGCESNERIAERKHNMRTLIALFVVLFIAFGMALTCNFGFLGASNRRQQAIFLKRLAQQEEARNERLRAGIAPLKPNEDDQNGGTQFAASAPRLETIIVENKESFGFADDVDDVDDDAVDVRKAAQPSSPPPVYNASTKSTKNDDKIGASKLIAL